MKKQTIFAVIVLLSFVASVLSHDLFLKLDSFFVKVNEKVSIKILNGSFMSSEGAVAFARLKDVSVVSPSSVVSHPVEADFTKDATTSFLNLEPKEPGNYVVGLSTMPREIDLKGKDFNEYLAEDGIPDTLADRKKKKELEKGVRERYSKNVKTIFQAGDRQTDNFNAILGYPVELVPQMNPYKLRSGSTIEILCLKDGKPLANQFVMSGREVDGKVVAGTGVRSNKKGIAKVELTGAGKWYVRFINMTKLTDPKINYESKWATLTFEIK